MKLIVILLIPFFLFSCSKPKTVLICGDHVCINKAEAEQFFEENLSIEVKVIDKKNKEQIDLVELNLRENSKEKRSISILSKNSSNENLKSLSNEDISKIRKKIKSKKKEKKIVKKIVKKNKIHNKIINTKKDNSINVNKSKKDVVDICTIIEKCSIDEISKYLIKQGKKKDFPNITRRPK